MTLNQSTLSLPTKAKCIECERVFDLLDENDAGEWYYGHDCEVPERVEHTVHVWSRSGSCMVDDCNVICGLTDPDEWCHECGGQFSITDEEVAYHVSATEPDGIDHDADANHVPYSISEEE